MKKIIASILFIASYTIINAQEIVKFKVSKPYAVFNFLETACNAQVTSATYKHYIDSATENNTDFKKMCSEFKKLALSYNYKRDNYPQNRRQYRTTQDLIEIGLVRANNWDEFAINVIGILPNSDYLTLIRILKQAEPYYNSIVWNENETKINHQKTALENYGKQASFIFNAFKQFYHSSWSAEMPFTVSIYPIPGKSGSSTAVPRANSLCVGVLADETGHMERVGVVLHEVCHVLYDEQDVNFQHELDKWFAQNNSPYKQYAYNFFDEGLATALGNGWTYKQLSGQMDTTDWYNNEYINGFAKALYPLVEEYITTQKTLDQAFVNKAIDLFAAKFPKSIVDYGILLNNVSMYNDAETAEERAVVFNTVGDYFQLSNCNISCPILDPISIEQLKNSPKTQLIVIDRNQHETLKQLSKLFPELKNVKIDAGILSFYDKQHRPIIVLIQNKQTTLASLVKQLDTIRYFNSNKIIQ